MGEPDEPPLSSRDFEKGKHPVSKSNKSHTVTKSVSAPNPANNDLATQPYIIPISSGDGLASLSTGTDSGSPIKTEAAGEEPSPIESKDKPPWPKRIKDGSIRFIKHTKDALTYTKLNILLIFVPVGIAVNFAPIHGTAKPTIVFAMNAIAIIPLAGLLSHATESVASRMGDVWASLLNVTFGNAVELIIFIIALAKNEIQIVQASILGSILANLLLILGMAFLFGGLRYREQVYNNTITQMSACLLSLSVVSLLLPTAFHASFADYDIADSRTLKISRGTSVVLLLIYILYLLFQLKTHAYLYTSIPQQVIDEESHPGVLADLMNSSSSDDSSSSSDSDSSSGSHYTTKKRIKRAFRNRRRRKSSASSTMTPSSPSVVSSPSVERRSVLDENAEDQSHHTSGLQSRDPESQSANISADEGDAEGDSYAQVSTSRIRDFGTEKGESSVSAFKSPEKRGSSHHKKRKKHSKKSKKRLFRGGAVEELDTLEMDELPEDTAPQETQDPRHVEFVEESTTAQAPETTISTSRRPFTRRQLSRSTFKPPPLPSLLSNTVFTQPPPIQRPGQTAGFSIAHHGTSGLRRTNSLPDRLNRPTSNTRSQSNTRAPATGTPTTQDPNSLPDDIPPPLATSPLDDPDPTTMSRTAAVMLLLSTTALVAFCAELLVDAIPAMVSSTTVSQAFIGLIVLPIVGNAAEHVTAVAAAARNKMDLAIGVAVGSSIQIALFVTPFVVLLGWILAKEMSLYFNLFETVSLFVTAFVVNFLVLDGRSNYLEGGLLIAAYVIIAVAAFFYPNQGLESKLGGGPS